LIGRTTSKSLKTLSDIDKNRFRLIIEEELQLDYLQVLVEIFIKYFSFSFAYRRDNLLDGIFNFVQIQKMIYHKLPNDKKCTTVRSKSNVTIYNICFKKRHMHTQLLLPCPLRGGAGELSVIAIGAKSLCCRGSSGFNFRNLRFLRDDFLRAGGVCGNATDGKSDASQ